MNHIRSTLWRSTFCSKVDDPAAAYLENLSPSLKSAAQNPKAFNLPLDVEARLDLPLASQTGLCKATLQRGVLWTQRVSRFSLPSLPRPF